jgi:hypothetical protein
MISFFRRIRQKMLSENKLSKYLIYAFGEIILVVIGILIALQINNANENLKKLQFEITILENIKEDILADKLDFELNLNYIKVEIANEQRLLDFMFNKVPHQTDDISFIDALGIDMLVVFHNASFNNLQNNDIGLISNNDLYKKLTRFYDFYESGLKELENDHEYANTYKEKLFYFKKHFKVINHKTKIEIGKGHEADIDTWKQDFKRYDFEIKNVESLFSDEEFKILLAESLFVNSIKFSFYEQLFEKINKINQAIDNELRALQK